MSLLVRFEFPATTGAGETIHSGNCVMYVSYAKLEAASTCLLELTQHAFTTRPATRRKRGESGKAINDIENAVTVLLDKHVGMAIPSTVVARMLKSIAMPSQVGIASATWTIDNYDVIEAGFACYGVAVPDLWVEWYAQREEELPTISTETDAAVYNSGLGATSRQTLLLTLMVIIVLIVAVAVHDPQSSAKLALVTLLDGDSFSPPST
jgi:hypothetical protein